LVPLEVGWAVVLWGLPEVECLVVVVQCQVAAQ
jgi:hypothetical protein